MTELNTPQSGDSPTIHTRLGHLTRQLHDSLNQLGLAEKLHGAAGELPDARTRLTYIARLTGEAAEKVLNNVERAKATNEEVATRARRLATLVQANPIAAVSGGHVMNFLAEVEGKANALNGNLTEIMLAQDFHDLTGQVIARVVKLAATIEEQLVELLIATAPPEYRGHGGSVDGLPTSSGPAALDGPCVEAKGRTDVVTDQSEVDDLLASLGF